MSEFLVWQAAGGTIEVREYDKVQLVPEPWSRWQVVRVDSALAALRWAMKRWQ